MKKDLAGRCLRCSEDLFRLCGVDCCVVDTESKHIVRDPETAGQSFCDRCSFIKCRARATHSYGCNESYRWGGYYSYCCPLGFSFVAGYICGESSELVGGLVAGPVLLDEDREESLRQLQELTRDVNADDLPILNSAGKNSLGHIVSQLCRALSETEAFSVRRHRSKTTEPRHTAIAERPPKEYPLEQERLLHEMICRQDGAGAKELLDKLFDHVYSSSGGDLEVIKRRSIELMVIISRASMEAGADAQEVFNEGDYLSEIQQIGTVDQLHSWLTTLLRRFIDYTFEFQQVKHANAIFSAKRYIQKHYREKITLENVATHTFFSPGYLSNLFKEETGESFVGYINRVRVETSKSLLLQTDRSLIDIATACGFEDQSYFARVFKKVTGISPSKYRFYRGRV